VLWIRNTVDDAQGTYEELRQSDDGRTPVALLHSRFPLYVREQLENEWMEKLGKNAENRPAGCVLVATQVAEQSVDIDADLLITDLAPTDMLLQRLGRLWRHDRSSRPLEQAECWLQMPDAADDFWRGAGKDELRAAFGKSARVYAPYVLLRSLIQWRSRRHIALPSDIRTVLERTYEDARADDPPAWAELRAELENHNRKMAALAMSATAVWAQPDLADEEGVQTRYNSYPSAELLLIRGIDRLDKHSERVVLLNGETVTVHDREWSFATAKAMHWNLVRVPRWAAEAGFGTVSRGVANHVSQRAAVGVVQDGAVFWPGQTKATRLTYYPDRGIVIDRKGRADEPHD
jgi:CRISPR-associated endonuclease/helicase Cas3